MPCQRFTQTSAWNVDQTDPWECAANGDTEPVTRGAPRGAQHLGYVAREHGLRPLGTARGTAFGTARRSTVP